MAVVAVRVVALTLPTVGSNHNLAELSPLPTQLADMMAGPRERPTTSPPGFLWNPDSSDVLTDIEPSKYDAATIIPCARSTTAHIISAHLCLQARKHRP